MSQLFSPCTLGRLLLKNRIIVSPMCQYSSVDGLANDWHMIHLGHLALSGAAALFTEAAAVEPDGRITPGDLGLYDDATQAALGRVIDALRRQTDMRLGVQLNHAGRKASTAAPWEGGKRIGADAGGWLPCAPSAESFTQGDPVPTELDDVAMLRIKEAFAASARRAHALGLDMVEVHAAHGYLLHQFLSPLSNHRTDHYGGSLANRLRYPLEVFAAVRGAFPQDKAVGVRVSATDWVDGGWDLTQTLVFAEQLRKLGCDFIDVSSGGLTPHQQIVAGPNYQVPFAAKIKETTGLPTIAVGLITEPEQAEAIIATGQADAIALARAMLYDPRWPWHAAARLGAQVDAPKQYHRSQPRQYKHLFKDLPES
jgi:2,4-dienoyl-CoA reductase-like NADH-dependent reductase (Old Yellow Enzyme family)